MDLNNVRRVSSAGYRLPERACGTQPTRSRPPADRTLRARGGGDGATSAEPNSDRSDTVKQDRVWKEAVQAERRGVREWEKNWNFLRNYDQMGQLKSEEPMPSYVSLFSDRVPNTGNQMFGSRLSTPLGISVVRLDRLTLRSARHPKCEQDTEMQP
ncbi:uncharacterized protein C2orf50 homolog [Cyclopterus lumpus]|uniref:Ciliary microtubule inner protein 5 n=1 Tax=Cyclopterus lumpus TaxID=8103 RepID=A0A8C2XLC5_CYCLU|nr:uncharacterized protein C2orf50 homolog [Cyclopterus lumpus]